MLKRILVAQLRLGMHIHALDGPWLQHPFWKTKFVLSDGDDLRRLHDSGVPSLWIDTAYGLDVADADAALAGADAAAVGGRSGPESGAPVPQTPVPQAAEAPSAAPPAANHTLADELHRAADLVRESRDSVQRLFGEARLGKAVDAQQCRPLVDDIAASVFRNPAALVSIARLKTADEYSFMHSVAVCALMVALARQMGLDAAACRDAGMAGLLHDLGKATIPLAVLNKPGKLSEAEWLVMRSHPSSGHALLVEGGTAPQAALDVCLHHHERMDGTGYPHRLQGPDLSLMVRMGAVCDVYDAVTSNRPYKPGWDPGESIAQMAGWKGHFDPTVFQAFVRSLGIYPVGSLVRMASGRLAVVVEQNDGALTSPVVKTFYSTRSNLPTTPERVDLARKGCADRILGREEPAHWGFKHLDSLWAEPKALQRLRG